MGGRRFAATILEDVPSVFSRYEKFYLTGEVRFRNRFNRIYF